jgi:hypothetical protein
MPRRNWIDIDEKRLASDMRAFDAVMVHSMLRWANAQKARRTPDTASSQRGTESFRWVSSVLKARASALGVSPRRFVWRNTASKLASHWFVEEPAAICEMWGALRPKWRADAEQWLAGTIREIPLFGRMGFESGRTSKMFIPLLTSVDECVAYAFAAVLDEENAFRSQVRKCRYASAKLPEHHFLDRGLFGEPQVGAPKLYCCESHANRDRQAQYRRRQKEKK